MEKEPLYGSGGRVENEAEVQPYSVMQCERSATAAAAAAAAAASCLDVFYVDHIKDYKAITGHTGHQSSLYWILNCLSARD